MAEHSTIEWTDATWNVLTGCSVYSPGCTNCYAMKLAGGRLQHHPSRAGLTKPSAAGPVWTGEVRFNEQWLSQPQHWRKPRKIFVCAHSDLFHESVPDEIIDQVFAVMAETPWHTFQVLTKRAARMRQYLTNPLRMQLVSGTACILGAAGKIRGLEDPQPWPLPNVILMVSAERQQEADERIPELLATPATRRGVSLEPLLGPINLKRIVLPIELTKTVPPAWQGIKHVNFCIDTTRPGKKSGRPGLDWVIAGGESGAKARPTHPDWFRSLRDQCAASGVAFLFKQWGEHVPADADWVDPSIEAKRLVWSDGTQWSPDDGQRGRVALMARVGKAAAGRLLDGVEHNGMPAIAEASRA